MIRHILFFTVPADRLEAAEAGLKPLERIAHADLLEVRRNLRGDDLSREVDLVVYGEFADETALEQDAERCSHLSASCSHLNQLEQNSQ